MAAPRSRGAAPTAFYALAVPGIEDLAADELGRANALVSETLAGFDRRDSLLLFRTGDIAAVLRCGLIEDLFRVVLDTRTRSARAGLVASAAALERAALEAALRAHRAVRPKGGRSFKVVARMAGRHAFRREDVQRTFASRLHELLPHWVEAADASVELWVHVVGERTVAGVRLSGDELAQRGWKRAHLTASLKPTVARALAVLTEPRVDDVFLDPMAGAGTVVRERAEAGRARLLLAGDSDPAALEASRTNARRAACLVRWDATRLPLRDASIDAIATNPPYGRQHEARGGTGRLYAAALREMARVLRPKGRCVVLAGDPAAVTRDLPPALGVHARRRLLVRGLPVTAFVMVRR